MKYIKLFENFSNDDWKKNILENTYISKIIEDLIYMSSEYLDVKGEDKDDPSIELEKTLIFDIMLEDEEGSLDSIVNGYYNYSQDEAFEKYLHWNNSPCVVDDLNDIPKLLNSGELKMTVNFAIVTGVDDGNTEYATTKLAPGTNIPKIDDDNIEYDNDDSEYSEGEEIESNDSGNLLDRITKLGIEEFPDVNFEMIDPWDLY
jgi:hypothetical protein